MKILTKDHIITGKEYFRQIEFFEGDSDNYAKCSFISHWMSIKYLIGPIWKNKPLKDLSSNTYYEFVLFDNEDEKKLTKIYTDHEIKYRVDLNWHIFRLWDDWIADYWNTLTNKEKQQILNFNDTMCPICKIKLTKNGYCHKCGFGNILNDDTNEWRAKCKEIKLIHEYLTKNKINSIN